MLTKISPIQLAAPSKVFTNSQQWIRNIISIENANHPSRRAIRRTRSSTSAIRKKASARVSRSRRSDSLSRKVAHSRLRRGRERERATNEKRRNLSASLSPDATTRRWEKRARVPAAREMLQRIRGSICTVLRGFFARKYIMVARLECYFGAKLNCSIDRLVVNNRVFLWIIDWL